MLLLVSLSKEERTKTNVSLGLADEREREGSANSSLKWKGSVIRRWWWCAKDGGSCMELK